LNFTIMPLSTTKSTTAADLVGAPVKTSISKTKSGTNTKKSTNHSAGNSNLKEPNKMTQEKDTKQSKQSDSKASKNSRTSKTASRSSSSSASSTKSNRRSSAPLNHIPDGDLPTQFVEGILETTRNGHGVLRIDYANGDRDTYISSSQMRRFNLRSGDYVKGPAREPKENERYWGLLQIDEINGMSAEEFRKLNRPDFMKLTPVYPDEMIKLETGKEPLSLRIIDLVAPIGKGQRSLLVSPPKAGKTILLKNIATGVAKNSPEVHIMAVLVGERPEEVTDIKRHIEQMTKGKGETAASNFDESAEEQVIVAELALNRAKRLVEMGQDVMILLDSITRLARAYNLAMPTSGRTLSGGFDPAALFPPKKFFGAARNFEGKGSLTIVGTALVDTGSRMDDLIYEEFKGTGNQEVHLDRRLAERRIYPAIDVQRSGTRKDDLLLDQMEYQSVITLQRMLDTLNKEERTSTLIDRLKRTDSNKEFLASLKTG
jgi:transcription termination factor Rho